MVEPAGAAVLAGGALTRPNHRIQGGGYAMPELPLLDRALKYLSTDLWEAGDLST